MKNPMDLTVEVLKDIRGELGAFRRDVNERLDATNASIDGTNARADATNERLDALERRQTSSEVRIATEIVGVVGAIHELRDVIVADRAFREQIHDHELRLTRLEKRAG